MADNSDKFTKRDARADTADIPSLDGDERNHRAMSYRERQRAEAERNGTYRSYARPSAEKLYREAELPRPVMERKTPLKTKKKKARHSTAYRVVCAILGILIGLIVVLSGAAAWYFHSIDFKPNVDLNNNDPNKDAYTQTVQTDDGPEIRVYEAIYEGEERYTLSKAIREWKKQGTAYLQSNKVINILLAGIDRNDDGSDGRTDSMILASINLNTKTIILSSIYRDCWMYETFDGGERSAWAKLNACYVYGGAEGLITNIEDYFKIHIDHFAGVDFESFKEIIDIMGGISVPLQDYEAEYINEQTGYTANACKAGDSVKLDGFQALWYVRMRHSDADEEISRTRRQRQFITALINEFKSTGPTELTGIINTFSSYIVTDMTKTDIVNYGLRAITQKWYNYEIRQQQVPGEEFRMEFYRQGYFDNQWVWVVDYPGAAKAMQEEIYGYSNIVLNENRRTMVNIWRNEY